MKLKKVIAAMSGGVDSSVAAKLLFDKNYEVAGMFLHFWSSSAEDSEDKQEFNSHSFSEGRENKCCSAEAFADARRVCQKIGIPLYALNFSQVFKKEIVDNFINEHKRGNTPNPCARCNKFVKLGLLIKRAEKLGFDFVASGHYARSRKFIKPARNASQREVGGSKVHPVKSGKAGAEQFNRVKSQKYVYKLYRARDKNKDQSYFLYNLTQEQLKRLIFPLGEFTKDETRKMARKFKMAVAEKKDSQEVCFIPEKSHNEFLKRYIKMKPGNIISLTPACPAGRPSPSPASPRPSPKQERGIVIGHHQGLPLYTIGQRRGIEIGGTGPYYAAKFDYKKNILYVVNDVNHPALFSDKLIAKNVNWISGQEPKLPLKCEAVIRYRHKAVKCIITSPLPVRQAGPTPLLIRRGDKGVRHSVKFSKPQRAVTPGQSVVFYKGDEVLGGGVIDRVGANGCSPN